MLLPFLFLLAQGQQPGAGAPLAAEEYFALKRIEDVQLSADGRSVAFIATGAEAGADRYRNTLFVWESGSNAQPLALAFADVSRPRWSPDGEWLAFVASRPAAAGDGSRPALWLVPRFAAEPIPLGDFDGGVIDYGWSPDGAVYAIVESEGGDSRDFWQLSVPDGEAELIWGGDPAASEMAISPDGEAIAFSGGAAAAGDPSRRDIWILDLQAKDARRLTSRAGRDASPIWAPDGAAIVFQAPQDPRLTLSQTELFSVPVGGGAPRLLTGAFDRSVIEHRWPSAGELVFSAAIGMYTHLFVWRTDGSIEQLLGGAYNYGPFAANAVGSTFFTVRQSAKEAPELWRIHGDEVQPLTRLNHSAADRTLGRQAVIQWTAPDGMAIEGLLVFPVDFHQGDRYPLLVQPGPQRGGRVRNVLLTPQGYQLFAAQGYAVLTANVRGAAGYGEAFLTASRNDLAGGDVADLLGGIDYLIKLGIADSTRLAVFGEADSTHVFGHAMLRERRFAGAHVDPAFGATAAAGPEEDIQRFFHRLRLFDRYLKFDGAENVAFYRVGEWVVGPDGWEARVSNVDLDAPFQVADSTAGRLLTLTVEFRPQPGARRVRALRIDAAAAVSLTPAAGQPLRTAGVVAPDSLGHDALVDPGTSDFTPTVSAAEGTADALRIVFEIPDAAAEYRLRIAGFAPVRIWAGTR